MAIPRVYLIEVIKPNYHREKALANMAETEALVKTFGGQVVGKDIQHRVKPDPATYIGSGKLEKIIEIVRNQKINIVVLNGVVKAGQLFRVEQALWKLNRKIKVWDRVDLILHIFEQHAHSTEARLQIELARIQHEGPRIYGLGKTYFSRQGGGIGTRGVGETNVEKERRIIKDRVRKLKKQIKKLSEQKRHKIRRRVDQGLGPVALVGYTSAGKTTLFNLLTGKQKQTNQALFTTLDTVVGRMKVKDQDPPVIISDTIGFIRDLPPELVDAFKSTLLESLESRLILHVVDAADPDVDQKIEVVEQILCSLKVTQPLILIFNKVDRVSYKQRLCLSQDYANQEHLFVSAAKGDHLDELKELVREKLDD